MPRWAHIDNQAVMNGNLIAAFLFFMESILLHMLLIY